MITQGEPGNEAIHAAIPAKNKFCTEERSLHLTLSKAMQTHYNIISRNRFATLMDLIDHMVRQHAADMDVNSMGFKNYASFLSWKEEQEFYSN